ncbi:transcriptional regulator [Roseivirga seohaensis subsp. aquiponti]|uniref:Transcriptional regulator n=1 Tax=Roseivirga seohaensis subsp. aquiponti TaxID=1566026 RepID=A0A0L8APA0_9BACT|nr:winged helix-turn-helix domain-containing protein [Roseivirga seohaensis]KOF04017.1 transcriptional regulator [Roseivirga seohaensis subsp. aquiponti]
MLEALISSKTRIKLLLRLFLNPDSSAYLRGLAEEFNESTNSIRVELNRFEEAGMLDSDLVGNKKVFKANKKYPLFQEVRSILLKYTGLQDVIDEVVEKLGDLSKVYLSGDLALGKDSDVVSLIFVGNPDLHYLVQLIQKAESLVPKKIQYLVYSNEEAAIMTFDPNQNLLIWNE